MRRVLFALLPLAVACNGDTEIQQLWPELTISPEEVDFEEVVVDYTETFTFEIINTGRAPLTVESISFRDHPNVYSVDQTSFQLGWRDDDNRAELTLSFTPPTYLEYDDVMVITSSAQSTSDQEAGNEHITEIPIAGFGGDGPTPDIQADCATMDFGEVIPPSTSVLTCVVYNTGDGDLLIEDVVQSGSGDFTLVANPSGQTISPGGNYAIVVLYAPPLPSEPEEEIGDNGSLTLFSNDPDDPEVLITLLANGGGDFEYPVAIIDGPRDPSPPDTITLDGSDSYDPNGYAIVEYTWALIETPRGPTATEPADNLEETSDAFADLYLDLAGTYEVQLQVKNEFGVTSAPAVYRVDAIPADDIHVELIWDTHQADLDLHMLADTGATLFDRPDDVCWCNPHPNWGDSLTDADDPRLDIDDVAGSGPENINITEPADGEYPVRVHYFDDNNDGAVTATVIFYLNGVEEERYSRVLDRNDIWEVGTIRWPDAVVIEEDNEPYAATQRVCD
ncbi:MAG: choice-of-anchor D domain-containing protein [Alphaproteobacteria bacterium]|nr:choice-of-anchor D domain-containing protein [Alphaproteobacteria bacterium]MCB9791425.1 choice-of-anchor D domain-containing protein [Alphaproteobacteria bacterium]